MIKKVIAGFLTFGFAFNVCADVNVESIRYEDSAVVGQTTLQLNGAGLRKKTIKINRSAVTAIWLMLIYTRRFANTLRKYKMREIADMAGDKYARRCATSLRMTKDGVQNGLKLT